MQTGNVLLSIVIPAYNAARFLNATLTMLVEQGLDNCEVIIINDGSTDDTDSICKEFMNKYMEISYITQKNTGVSAARNRGMELAKGKYVYFFDSDDSLPAGTLDFFRSVLARNLPMQMFSFGYEMRRNGSLIKKYISSKFDNQMLNSHILQGSFFEKKLPCNICSCIYDRAFLENHAITFTKGVKIGEDVEFIIKALNKVDALYYSKRVCFIYQLRDDSAMQGYKIYTPERMKSFELIRDTVLSLNIPDSSLEPRLSFFIANLYVSNLFAYLFSAGDKSKKIEDIFFLNKKYVYKRMKGKVINLMAIYLIRYIPLRFLFQICKNY